MSATVERHRASIAAAVERYGRLDCAVANAGIVHVSDFLDLDEADFDRVIRVNLKGVFLTGQSAARQMTAQGGGGSIIMLSSVAGLNGAAGLAGYSATKGAVRLL